MPPDFFCPVMRDVPYEWKSSMTAELLPAIQFETGANPGATVIWLHGLGDDGNGWSQVVGALGLPNSLRVRFLFPHAPVMPVTINNGMAMRAWYDIREANLNSRADLAGVRRSQSHVEALIAREVARGVPERRIVLAGFSQGGAIALYAGLRHPARLAGIVALSTYLIDGSNLAAEASPANRDVPIFMAHGTQDPGRRVGLGGTVTAGAGRWRLERRLAHLSDGTRRGPRGSGRLRQVPGLRAEWIAAVMPVLRSVAGFVLGRIARSPAEGAAPGEGVAQQEFDLRVGAAQLRLRQPFDFRPQSGIDAQQERLLFGHRRRGAGCR